jgi:hypothetical protein
MTGAMLMTIQPNTTPTRRSAIGFTLAALTAGLTVPVLASAATSELIATCDRFFRLDDRLIQFDTGALELDEDVLDRLWPVHFALIDQITSITAQTHAERIAKAKAAFAVMRYAGDVDSKAYDNLVRSALTDVIAGSAAA